MTQGRAMMLVVLTACAALCALLLPGDWKGLAVLPAFVALPAWRLLGPEQAYHGAHALTWDTADSGDPPFWGDPVPELARLTGPVGPPDESIDPVGYYQHQAWQRTGEPWQQRAADDTGPHLLAAPTIDPAGPVARPPSLDGPSGPLPALDGCTCTAPRGAHRPPCVWATQQVPELEDGPDAMQLALEANDRAELGIAPLELDHEAELEDQAAELEFVALPTEADLLSELAFEDLLDSTRWTFARLKEAYL